MIANLRGFKIWGRALQFDAFGDFWEDKKQPKPGAAEAPPAADALCSVLPYRSLRSRASRASCVPDSQKPAG